MSQRKVVEGSIGAEETDSSAFDNENIGSENMKNDDAINVYETADSAPATITTGNGSLIERRNIGHDVIASSSYLNSSTEASKSQIEIDWEDYLAILKEKCAVTLQITKLSKDRKELRLSLAQLYTDRRLLSEASMKDPSQWSSTFRNNFDSIQMVRSEISLVQKILIDSRNDLLELDQKLESANRSLNELNTRIDEIENVRSEFREERLLMKKANATAPTKYEQSPSSYATSGHEFEMENEGNTFCYQKKAPQSLSLMLPEIFGQLEEDLTTVHYDAECHKLVFEMSDTYKENEFQHEKQMKQIFRQVWAKWLGSDYHRKKKKDIPKLRKLFPNDHKNMLADGIVLCKPFVTAFIGYKRILGAAYVQAIVSYFNYISSLLSNYVGRNLRIHHYMPALAITFTGPYLNLFGLMTEFGVKAKVHAEHYATVFICTNTNDQKRIQTLTNFYSSVRKALDRLKLFYWETQTFVTPARPFGILHPMIRHVFIDGNMSSPCELEYISRIDFQIDAADDRIRCIFKVKCISAVVDPSKRWIAKFFIAGPQAESVAVQSYCARQGFAPAVLGWRQLNAGWWVIVMEDLRKNFTHLPQRIAPETLHAIHVARQNLHAEQRDENNNVFHYVHGDFRPANVLVHKKDRSKIMIVDFDWAGKQGLARFPISMWPPAVHHGGKPLELIEKQHDEFYFR